MTGSVKHPLYQQWQRTLRTVAELAVAVLFLSQAVCHGCPMTDKSDPTTVFSTTLSDRAVLCLSPQGSVAQPTKCRPDTGAALPAAFADRTESVHGPDSTRCAALHLACSSRKLLLLKSHLLI
jgi:hypothetical protein